MKTELVHDSTKNKILLISIVVAIFVFSIGLIAWVVMRENYDREYESVTRTATQTDSSVIVRRY